MKAEILDQYGNPISVRRWESAATNRLNSDKWARATDNNINVDLSMDLETLRTRTAYEAANNPILAGVIRTHQTDVVGPNGPELQVESANSAYSEALEDVWAEWFAMPDIQGRMSGTEKLRQDVRQLWICGEAFTQLVQDPSADGNITLRLLSIHARRLRTPGERIGDDKISLGIRVDQYGRPIEYFIAKELGFGDYSYISTDYSTVPANAITHLFLVDEPDQARGYPLAASALQVISDLRSYDAQVLSAAEAAANWGVVLQSAHPQLDPLDIGGGDVEWQRGVMRALPAGWTAQQFQSTQPMTNYVEFRHERQAEIGRPVGMPLMMVRLDSGDHNYSSARFDGQLYQRDVATMQRWIERVQLNHWLDAVAREAELTGAIPARPADARYVWKWPGLPHVDPSKEAEAEGISLNENRTLPFVDALAARGISLEDYLAKQARAIADFKAAGIPLPESLREEPSPVRPRVGADAPATSKPNANKQSPKREDGAIVIGIN